MWNIGNRLREQREKVELDIGQVAEYENISKSYISQLETGKNTPNWDLLARLARRYETSADYILGLTDDSRPANGKALPPGGIEVLEYLANMSIRGRAIFLTAARAYYEADRKWQTLNMVMDVLSAFPGGLDIMETLSEDELAELKGFAMDGVRMVIDANERVIRIIPSNGNFQSSTDAL